MRLAVLAMICAGPVWADVPRVVTDFGPVQSLVADVMGDIGAPVALLPKGGDPHDFQLRPSQAGLLADADLVFWVGPELMPALGDALGSLAGGAKVVALLDVSGHKRQFADGGTDPHGWLDPANGQAWLGTIAEALAGKDPEHAADYRANAAAAAEALAAENAAWVQQLAPVKDRPFVVYHDALGYFADHFGLNLAGAIELSNAASPSAAQLAAVQGVITAGGVVCVFPEVGRDPKFIAALTEGLPVKIGAAQDIEFIDLAAGRGQYAVLLDNLVRNLTDCLGD